MNDLDKRKVKGFSEIQGGFSLLARGKNPRDVGGFSYWEALNFEGAGGR